MDIASGLGQCYSVADFSQHERQAFLEIAKSISDDIMNFLVDGTFHSNYSWRLSFMSCIAQLIELNFPMSYGAKGKIVQRARHIENRDASKQVCDVATKIVSKIIDDILETSDKYCRNQDEIRQMRHYDRNGVRKTRLKAKKYIDNFINEFFPNRS